MSSLNQLGANIRSLRKAYGETQEDLAAAMHLSGKSAISNYEAGNREPDKQMVSAIAKYYRVSVDELLYGDLTFLGEAPASIHDTLIICKNIDTIFPIISSDKALQNEHFSRAYNAHNALYDQIRSLDLGSTCNINANFEMCVDNMVVCMEGYSKVAKEDDIAVEAVVNCVAVRDLMVWPIKGGIDVIKGQVAFPRQVIERIRGSEKAIEDLDPSLVAYMEALLSEIDDDEMQEVVLEMLTMIKQSGKWSDLADYYLALQYFLNLVDNDLSQRLNQRIGCEMLHAFASIGNIYATKWLEINALGASSRSVVDSR